MSSLLQIMAWRRLGTKPLSESVMAKSTDAYVRHSASVNLRQCRKVDADVFIHLLYVCLFKYPKLLRVLFVYHRCDVFLLFYSGYSVFILCIHWPITLFNVYDFNLCVFYHVLGQRWPNKRVQSIIWISGPNKLLKSRINLRQFIEWSSRKVTSHIILLVRCRH